MKIRSGFVSNSSSSSFCIYGASMSVEDMIEKLKKTLPEDDYDALCESEEYEMTGLVESKTNLDVYINDGSFWIGRSWSSIEDDETGGKFKEDVKEKIEKFLGSGIELDTYEEEIYNG